jgi:hypothetical protein
MHVEATSGRACRTPRIVLAHPAWPFGRMAVSQVSGDNGSNGDKAGSRVTRGCHPERRPDPSRAASRFALGEAEFNSNKGQ